MRHSFRWLRSEARERIVRELCKRATDGNYLMAKKRKGDIVNDERYKVVSERSPYWDDFSRGRGARGEQEHPLANPDVLPEQLCTAPSTPHLILGEAIEHLQGRQREVYLLTMRESKSLADTAEILGIEKSTAQKYKERAIEFITQYCKRAIKAGRI